MELKRIKNNNQIQKVEFEAYLVGWCRYIITTWCAWIFTKTTYVWIGRTFQQLQQPLTIAHLTFTYKLESQNPEPWITPLLKLKTIQNPKPCKTQLLRLKT
jgi:hypothetical protein